MPEKNKSVHTLFIILQLIAVVLVIGGTFFFIGVKPVSALFVILSLGQALIFFLLYGKVSKKQKNYDDVILQNLHNSVTLQQARDENPVQVLQSHMNACADSRMKTRELLQENESTSSEFVGQMKDSVYLVTSINGSVQKILEKIEGLNGSLLNSSSAIEEISQTMLEFSRQIESQSSSVVQTSAAVEEMDASIKNVSHITAQRSETSQQLKQITDNGQEQLSHMNGLIDEVNNNIGSVQDIISVINNIASQTNLLSMNAAIEAAHAGDAGKGFAVVADEIRKLAESTGTNAALISNTLKSVISNVQKIQGAGKESLEAYKSINEETVALVHAFNEIANATQELNVGSNEILEATQMLNSVTTNIRDGSQEITLSVRDIRDSINAIVEASKESETAVHSISDVSQDINLMFINVSKAIVNYEEYIEKIRAFQDFEFTSGDADFFSVVKIILQHLLWVLKARAVIDDKMEIDTKALTDHHSCALGRWIDNKAPESLKTSVSFRDLIHNHEKLHGLVNRIFESKGSMPREELEKMYSELLNISSEVIGSLTSVNV